MHNTLDKYESFIEATTKNISTYLSPYMEQLDKLYTWGDKAVEHNFVRENIAFDFSTLSSNFERTVQLKTSLQEMLKNTSSFGERYFIGEYFVVTWGGVRTNGDLKGLLASYDDLESPYGIKTLDKISSWSKYLSLKHEEAHIYDSRVAYAINAINFIYGNKDFFFQIPAGRSAKIGLLDIETLFMIEKIRANESFLASNALKHRQVASKTKKRVLHS